MRPTPPPSSDDRRACLRTAAWLAPIAWPAAILQFFALSLPWLTSVEAQGERLLISLAVDRELRGLVAATAETAGGLRGLAIAAALLTAAWLVVVGARGHLGVAEACRVLLGRRGAPARRRAVLLAGGVGLLAGAVQLVRAPLERVVDLLITVRPTGPLTYGATLAAELLALTALTALVGVALAGARRAASPAAVRTAAALACALAGAVTLATTLACVGLARRFDVGRSLPSIVGLEPAASGETALAVITADGIARAAVPAATGGVPHEPALGLRVAAFLDGRGGQTALADAAERYVMAERLAAFDPVGAQEAAWLAVQRRGAARTAHALLFSLATAPKSARSLGIARDLATSRRLRLGPQALALLAAALDHQGDPALARLLRERLATAGSARLPPAPGDGGRRSDAVTHLAGNLRLGGSPYRGPFGALPAEHLPLLLQPGQRSPVAFLLRLSAVGLTGPDGEVSLPEPAGTPLALVVPAAADALTWRITQAAEPRVPR